MVMSKVSPSAKIPLKQFLGGKGSFNQRLDYAKKLNYDFYKQVCPEIKKGMISPITYRKLLKNLLPDNIKLHITKLPQSIIEKGIFGRTIQLGNTINGFTISLPYEEEYGNKNKNGMISLKNFSTMMHENFHLFVEAANPKFSARCSFEDEQGYEVFNQNLYGPAVGSFGLGKMFKIMQYLKTKPLEDRINFLQLARYHLYEEHYAYIEGANYSNSMYNNVPFNFKPQIAFLEMLLYANIQKARKQNELNLLKSENE